MENINRRIAVFFVVLGLLTFSIGAPVLEIWIKVQLIKLFW